MVEPSYLKDCFLKLQPAEMFAFRCKPFNFLTILLTMSRGGEMFTSWTLPQAFTCIFGPSSVIWPTWHCTRRCRSTAAWTPSFLAVPAFSFALELAHSWSHTSHHTDPNLQNKPQKIQNISALFTAVDLFCHQQQRCGGGSRAWTRGNDSKTLASTQFRCYLVSIVKTQLFPSTVVITHISKQESLLIALSHVWTHGRARQKPETWLGIPVREAGAWCLLNINTVLVVASAESWSVMSCYFPLQFKIIYQHSRLGNYTSETQGTRVQSVSLYAALVPAFL